MAVAPKEIDIQAGFKAQLRYVAPSVSMVAIPNAGKRSRWAAAQVKKEGMATGFPDVMCIWPDAGVCFLEFKTPKGRLSENQQEWIGRLDARGHKVAVVRSVEEALAFLRKCGAPVVERAA